MNNVIFDWESNSLKIMETGRYSTNNRQYLEQLNLISLLIEQGYDKQSIYSIWKNTDSLILSKIKDDIDEIDFVFNRIYLNAKSWKVSKGNQIKIYQEEIDYINSLEVLPWIKEYLLALLSVYKFYSKPWCLYSEDIRRFCFSTTYYGRERDKMRIHLSDCLNRYEPYRIYTGENGAYFKCNFAKETGELLVTIEEPRQVQETFKYIKNEKVCNECGNKFEYNSKTIRNELCPECSKKLRYKKQYECHLRQQGSVKS